MARRWMGHDISMYPSVDEFGEDAALASHVERVTDARIRKDFSEAGFWQRNQTGRCSFHLNTTQQMAQF